MRTSRHSKWFILLLSAVLLAGATSAWAGGSRHHRYHHGHHHGHSGIGWGVGFAYPPAYGYYPAPGYGPGYGPVYGGSIAIGYGSGGHHGSWGVGLTLPLYLGPRYAPPTRTVVVPATRAAPRQSAADCLQVREYQTEIVVGGRTVPAYGDACLQPDGSWIQVTGPFAADY
jgi:hypothetical protein